MGPALLAPLLLLLGMVCAMAQTIEPRAIPEQDQMRVVLVRGDESLCAAECPEWISAEGAITRDTPAAFRAMFDRLGARNPPIFIRSPGGVVVAALEIGRMLAERKAVVAVTGTRFDGCRPTDPVCGREREFAGYRGTPDSFGASCASACPMLIAGAQERLVSPWSRIGVHQMSRRRTETQPLYRIFYQDIGGKQVEVGRELIMDRSLVDDRSAAGLGDPIVHAVQIYLGEMGISDRLVLIGLDTPPDAIHWLSPVELASVRLATRSEGGEALVERTRSQPAGAVAANGGQETGSGFAFRTRQLEGGEATVALTFFASGDPSRIAWTGSLSRNGRPIAGARFALGLATRAGRAIPVTEMAGIPDASDGFVSRAVFCRIAKETPLVVQIGQLSATGAGRFVSERLTAPDWRKRRLVDDLCGARAG